MSNVVIISVPININHFTPQHTYTQTLSSLFKSSEWTHHKRNAGALIYTPIDQNNKLLWGQPEGVSEETRNSINNFLWHLFFSLWLRREVERIRFDISIFSTHNQASLWYIGSSCLPSSSHPASSTLLILIMHTYIIKYFFKLPNLSCRWSWLNRWMWIGGTGAACFWLVVIQVSELGWIDAEQDPWRNTRLSFKNSNLSKF